MGNSRSRLPALLKWTGIATEIESVVELAKELTNLVSDSKGKMKILIVVESISEFLSTAADAALVELIKSVRRSRHLLIAEAESSNWGSSWPLLAEVKAGRRGILLQPENLEGETLLKISLPRSSRADFPTGRGFFVERGKATRFQVALPGGGDGQSAPSTTTTDHQ